MNARLGTVSLFISLICGIALGESSPDTIRWAPDLVSAREAAAKYQVPLVIHFHGDGCLPCRTLEQRVFSQAEVISTMNRYFICVAINGTKEPKLATDFAVHSWPTDVFLAPDGEVLYRGVSPQDSREYMGVLTGIAVTNRDRNLMLASQKAATESPSVHSSQPFSGSSLDTLKTSHPDLVGLPKLGTQSASTTATPNFYAAANQQTMTQQLAASTSPRDDIQSGPAIPSNQPTAIDGPSVSNNVQLPVLGKQVSHDPSSNPLVSSQLSGSVQTTQNSQFPDLPGLKQTQPMRSAQDTQHLLSSSSGVPSLENAAPQLSAPAQTSSSAQTSSKQNSITNPFQLTSSATTVAQHPTNLESSVDTADKAVSSEPIDGSEIGHSTLSSSQAERPNLDGFCPVALRQQQWMPGNADLAVKHRGKIYWFSSESAVEAFLKQPDEYAPAISGYDPQILLYDGKLVNGSTQHGLFEANSGQVLLFSSQSSKDEFQKNFEKNMQALTAVRQRAANNRVGSVK